jgi:hypothetical protein
MRKQFKPITKARAVRHIVNMMCRRGFMNGWFGDVTKEFRDEQCSDFMSLSGPEQRDRRPDRLLLPLGLLGAHSSDGVVA